jgi:hypothetical protein
MDHSTNFLYLVILVVLYVNGKPCRHKQDNKNYNLYLLCYYRGNTILQDYLSAGKIAISFDDGNHSVNAKIVHWRFLEWTGYEPLLNPSYYCFQHRKFSHAGRWPVHHEAGNQLTQPEGWRTIPEVIYCSFSARKFLGPVFFPPCSDISCSSRSMFILVPVSSEWPRSGKPPSRSPELGLLSLKPGYARIYFPEPESCSPCLGRINFIYWFDPLVVPDPVSSLSVFLGISLLR